MMWSMYDIWRSDDIRRLQIIQSSCRSKINSASLESRLETEVATQFAQVKGAFPSCAG